MKTHFLVGKIPKKEGFVKLQDAYSFDPRNREVWDVNWRDTGANSNLVAPKNYESVGFQLYDRKRNESESAFTGDYLYYEIIL